MSRDPLEQFRRQPQQAATAPAGANGLKPYVAFKAVDKKQDRLDIRRVLGDSGMPKYAFLVDIRYSRDFEDELVLKYTLYTVRIAGRNLRLLRLAIADSLCEWMEVFHPKEHIPPAPGEALITSIIFEPDELQDAAQQQKVEGKEAVA